MGSIILFFIALIALSFSARGLIDAVMENVNVLRLYKPYSVRALRVARTYKIASWSLLSFFLLFVAVQTFITVFLAL